MLSGTHHAEVVVEGRAVVAVVVGGVQVGQRDVLSVVVQEGQPIVSGEGVQWGHPGVDGVVEEGGRCVIHHGWLVCEGG